MLRLLLIVLPMTAALAVPASAAEQHGFVQFPRDEHQHVDGWDYWWGTADLVTDRGNRYTVGMGHVIYNGGVPNSSYILFPRQGPYAGQSVMTQGGPPEWGHPDPPGRSVRPYSRYVPGISELVKLQTRDPGRGGKPVDVWERTTLAEPRYRLRLDQDDAEVHPAEKKVRWGLDLDIRMRDKPLLAGGSGQWWYGIPQTYQYPSRSYQYMQAAQRMTGTLEVTQPDGTLLRERIVPERSRLLMVHEYDASPEDIPAGLATAEATQLHPRYVQSYNYDWPWELIYADLDNGAALMLGVLNFNDTEDGALRPATPEQPTFQILTTLMLPDGRSVPLDNRDLRVEHLSRRFLDGVNSVAGSTLQALFHQSRNFRVRYDGGTAKDLDGRTVEVPPFDLGLTPPTGPDDPAPDPNGNRMTQRVAYDVAGSYAGCPVHGFGWSELLVNWYGQEQSDPWYTGGALPPVPERCGQAELAPPGTPQNAAPPGNDAPYELRHESCDAGEGRPTCEFDPQGAGGIAGSSSEPGAWTVTITRPGRATPIVIRSHTGWSMFPCGTVVKGDHVAVRVDKPNSSVFVGNPGFCI